MTISVENQEIMSKLSDVRSSMDVVQMMDRENEWKRNNTNLGLPQIATATMQGFPLASQTKNSFVSAAGTYMSNDQSTDEHV